MILSVIVSFYLCISVFAVYMTYQEQKRRRKPSPLFNLISYVLCVLWPLALGAILIAVQFQSAKPEFAESE